MTDKRSPDEDGLEALKVENTLNQAPKVNSTVLLKFAVIPSNLDPETGKFLVSLEVPIEKLPTNPGRNRDWITEASDTIRKMFAPSDSCVYLLTEPDQNESSKLSMKITFDQLRTDLVDANVRLSNIERAANDVVGAWEGGEDLAAAVCALRRKLLERL